MANPIRKIVEELVANLRDQEALPKALGAAAAHGTFLPNDVLVAELTPLVKEIDQLKGSNPDFELAASLVCRQVAEGGPIQGLGGLTDSGLKTHITFLLGRSMLSAGYLDEADHVLQEAEQGVQDFGHREKLPGILATRGSLCLARKDIDGALTFFSKAEKLFQEFGDVAGEASTKYGIAQALSLIGDIATARKYYQTAVELNRVNGQKRDEFICLVMLAQTFNDETETREKRNILSAAVATASSTSIELDLILPALAKLGTLCVRLEDSTQAEAVLDEGLSLSLNAGDRYFESFFAHNLGSVFAGAGRTVDARRLFLQSLSASKAIGDTEGVLLAERNLELLATKNVKIAAQPQIHRVGTPLDEGDKPNTEVESALRELRQKANQMRQLPDVHSRLREQVHGPVLTEEIATPLVDEALRVTDSETDPLLALILLWLIKSRLPAGFDTHTKIVILARIASCADRANYLGLSIEVLTEARTLAKEAGLHDDQLGVSTNLATMLRRAGKMAESAALFEEVIDQIDTTTKPGTKAAILGNAATAYSDLGQHQRSLELSLAAIVEIENDPDNQQLLLICLINAAGTYIGLNKLGDAELQFANALSLARKLNNAAQEAVCLGHLGTIRMRQGKISTAVKLFEQAALNAERIGDLWNAQHWYFDLGNLYLWTGSERFAQACFERALAISQRIGDRRSEARAFLGLGTTKQGDASINDLFSAWETCQATGNYSLAVEVALQLVQAYVKQAVGLEEIRAAIAMGLSRQRLPENRLQNPQALKQARAWFDRGHAITKEHLGDTDNNPHMVLAETEVLRLEGRYQEAIANLQSVLVASSDPFNVRDSHAGLGGIYFHDLKDPARALPHFEKALGAADAINSQITFAEQRLQSRSDAAGLYLWMAECALALGLKEKAFAVCESAKNRELLRLWSYRKDKPLRVPTLAELSEKLEGRPQAIIQFMPSILSTTIFVIGPGLGPDGQIITLNNLGLHKISNWYKRILDAYAAMDTPAALFDSDKEAEWLSTVDQVCYEVGQELLAPIHQLLSQASTEIKSVTFIPYGLLHSIPLHAANINERSHWIDHYEVEYSPSSSLLVHTWTTPELQPRKFAAFADVIGDLPMARAEVSHAASLFGGQSKILVGDQASKSEALRQLNKVDWIHFACHATLSFGDPDGSGLSLAGSDKDQDEFLDLQELNRRGLIQIGSVAILSACESGMTVPYFSDEYISLGAGFISAGARSVISTYWEIQDVCALLIMNRFYEERFGRGRSLSQSLREAMISVRELNEDETYLALSMAIKALNNDSEEVSEEILEQFVERRSDIQPFRHIADWGAFQLVGGSRSAAIDSQIN